MKSATAKNNHSKDSTIAAQQDNVATTDSNSKHEFANPGQPQQPASSADLKAMIQQSLSADLNHVNQILKAHLRSSSPLVAEMVDHVSRYQGKQLRPILVLLTHQMSSGNNVDSGQCSERCSEHQPSALESLDQDDSLQVAAKLAAAVEMIHLATLVHDDVIDEADTRRHVATAHRRWDTEASVLLGDFLFSKAFHLSATTGDAGACALIGRATDRTCEGELNQMAARLDQSASEVDYFRIIRGKTGQLFSLSCRLGARSAAASSVQQAAAARFGHRLGLAFQIADDILDLTETTEQTGKDAANDVQNGRRTLPILRALRVASSEETEQLNGLLRDSCDTAFQQIKSMPCVTAGIESAAKTARQLIQRAIQDLACFQDSEERRLLRMIAEFAVDRHS